MRLKGVDKKQARRWRREQAENGYCPHYHKVGRIRMEVKFLRGQPRNSWVVVNLVTGLVHEFRKNGTPLGKTRGVLTGPIILKRKVKHA